MIMAKTPYRSDVIPLFLPKSDTSNPKYYVRNANYMSRLENAQTLYQVKAI